MRHHGSRNTLIACLVLAASLAVLSTGCLPEPYEIGAPDSTLNGYVLIWQLVDQNAGTFCMRPSVDWDLVYTEFRDAAEQAETWEEMSPVALQMLGALQDIGLILHDDSAALPSCDPGYFVNFDLDIWVEYMQAWGLPDTTLYLYGAGVVEPSGADSVGYLYIADLGPMYWLEQYYSVTNAVQGCSGLILDLRVCGQGGMEVNARHSVGRFVSQSATAYYRTEREGTGRTDMGDTLKVTAYKNGSWQFTEPIVVLTGRGTSGTGEELALLLATQEHVTLMGDTTAGFASESVTHDLVDGWSVSVPFQVVFDTEMVAVFDRGIPPDILVPSSEADFAAGVDPVLDAALEMLTL